MERARYQSELYRLATYANYPIELEGPPTAAAFARNGFVHIGNGRTQCFSCTGTINNWCKNDDVPDRHAQMCQDCEMVLGTSTENVPMQGTPAATTLEADSVLNQVRYESDVRRRGTASSVTDRSRSEANDYRIESVRAASFVDWPKRNVDTDGLARAGFYYTGVVDNAMCVFCHETIGSWSATDDPLHEHRRASPHCPFLMGRDVGNVPIPSLFDDSSSSTSDSSQSSLVEDNLELMSLEDGNGTRDCTEDEDLISKVVEMGFSEHIVREVYNKKDAGYASVNDLVEAVLHHESTTSTTAGALSARQSDHHHSTAGMARLEADGVVNVAQESARPRTDSEQVKKLQCKVAALKREMRIGKSTERMWMEKFNANERQSETERRQLQHQIATVQQQMQRQEQQLQQQEQHLQQLICMICTDAARETVLLPCGHLVMCEACCRQLRRETNAKCPVCRELIRSDKRVYLS